MTKVVAQKLLNTTVEFSCGYGLIKVVVPVAVDVNLCVLLRSAPPDCVLNEYSTISHAQKLYLVFQLPPTVRYVPRWLVSTVPTDPEYTVIPSYCI